MEYINLNRLNRKYDDDVIYLKNPLVRMLLIFAFIVCATILIMYSITPEEEIKTVTYRSIRNDKKWTWSCVNQVCEKHLYSDGDPVSLDTCNMLCDNPQIWPIPYKITYKDKKTATFTQNQLSLEAISGNPADTMVNQAFDIFKQNVDFIAENTNNAHSNNFSTFRIRLLIEDSNITKLSLDTDESYLLSVKMNGNDIIADISASTYFGSRHALETLSQLIWWDECENDGALKVLVGIEIQDKPSFKYRGLMVDTARNYFNIDLLKKVIDGMAANKLNTFHWHITDAQSFPLCLPNVKELCEYGAYSSEMVYSTNDTQQIIEYAKLRGIRVIIEIDAPSHMLSGWNWNGSPKDLVLSSPDGLDGQMNPNRTETMDVLKMIYSDVLNLMDSDEFFHIGGDEVDLNLWRNVAADNGYKKLKYFWADYMRKIFDSLSSANERKLPENIIIWSSPLTDDNKVSTYLDKNKVIIQHWYGNIRRAIDEGFRIIYSDVGDWYLDCGFGAWREHKNANCDPYRTWQIVYKLKPWKDINMEQVVGGEVCMWTEQVGEFSLETRIWPRTAAFAERIWSNPDKEISRHVYTRLDTQRTRLVKRGLKSEVLWPQFCTQNPGKC